MEILRVSSRFTCLTALGDLVVVRLYVTIICSFLPRATLSVTAVFAVSCVLSSVCLSVKFVHSIHMAEVIVKFLYPLCCPTILCLVKNPGIPELSRCTSSHFGVGRVSKIWGCWGLGMWASLTPTY